MSSACALKGLFFVLISCFGVTALCVNLPHPPLRTSVSDFKYFHMDLKQQKQDFSVCVGEERDERVTAVPISQERLYVLS